LAQDQQSLGLALEVGEITLAQRRRSSQCLQSLDLPMISRSTSADKVRGWIGHICCPIEPKGCVN
jgi:hypothetical protein